MKLKATLFTLLSSLLIGVNAQPVTYLDIGNVSAFISADGNLFQNIINSTPGFEIPKNSNKYTIYASSLWLTSKSQRNGIPHVASAYETYGNVNQFQIGPVDIVNQQGSTDQQFNRLWKINKGEINNHIQNWNSSNYVVPNNISQWPGNGTANTAQKLAPFADLDNDNIYEPQHGEYPIIKGDQAVYLILNDYRAEDTTWHLGNIVETYGPLKIEMHLMLYAFASNSSTINNTVFVEATIYNRSNSAADNHSDLRASVFTDFDLGNYSDDYVGTNISQNMFYAYNGDMFDESVNGNSGFGNQLAAQGVLFLDYNIGHSVYYNASSGQNGDPSSPSHFANYQRGVWKNGTQIRYGGDGYNSTCTGPTPSKLMFDGDPSLSNQTSVWTEQSPCIGTNGSANYPGDRRMVGGPDIPTRLNHGQSLKFNFAYVFAQDDQTSTSLGSPVSKLFQEASIVQTFFDSTITSVEHISKEKPELSLAPNPANNQVQIKTNSQNFEVELIDLKGSILTRLRNQNIIDLSDYSNGIYFVQITNESQVQTKKLVISR